MSSEPKHPSEPEAPPRSTVREYLEAILVALIFLGFSNTFVIKTFYIPSGSMLETLQIGDHLFVNRYIYGPVLGNGEEAVMPRREVKRGDIVIFRSPEDPAIDLVKRCIARGGDEVEVRNKQLFVNREKVEAPYVQHISSSIHPSHRSPRDNYAPFQVPDNHLFCMGDNRDDSYDSRYWGPVPQELVKGRAFLIYWSYGGETPDGTPRSWSQRLRDLSRTALGFFTRTRWNRTFKLIR